MSCGLVEKKLKLLGTIIHMFGRQDQHLMKTTPCQGGSIMLLGCVAAADTGNVVGMEGRKDSTTY